MRTFTVRIAQFPTADFPTYIATIDETGAGFLRGDRLDAAGDPRLGAWFPGISDHLTYAENLSVEPTYVQTGSNSGTLTFRSHEAEVIVHDIAVRPMAGSSDITANELTEIIAAMVTKAAGANAYPEEAAVKYIERLVDLGHIGIIHRVVHLYSQGNRRIRSVLASHLPRILSTKYRPILDAGGTAAFQFWAMQDNQKPLLDTLKANAGNSLLPSSIDDLVLAFEERSRGRAA